MATQDMRNARHVTFLERWGWCVLLFSFMGCSPAQPDAPFYRFVEDVDPADRWRETKVRIGDETRNVLLAPYRSQVREIEMGRDGTIAVDAVADLEKISADAAGITIEVEPITTADQSGERKSQSLVHGVYVPLRSEGENRNLDGTKVQILPVSEAPRRVRAWVREVVWLPQEYRTKMALVPRSGQLDFGLGIEEAERGSWSSSAQFTVEVEYNQGRRTVFSRTLAPGSSGAGSGWQDASVDLSHLAGTTVRFVFRTNTVPAEDGRADRDVSRLFNWSPVWSSPILYPTKAKRKDNRPNIILISLDTLRADHLGCYGYHRNTSPNIDKFADGGLLFENCIAPSSWTLPSHASVFTGLHPSVHRAGLYLYTHPHLDYPIEQGEITLAELARKHGYLTAACTEGSYVRASLGFAQGFERYSDGRRHSGASRFVEETFDNALQWIRKHRDLPFLLFVHTYEPHVPYDPPRRFVEMFDKNYTGTAGAWANEARSKVDRFHCEACYDGEIAYTDEVLGGFFADLKRMGLLQHTIIVLFSDHGEAFWEHGGCGHGNTLHEEVLRVPLVIRLAGERPPIGHVIRQVSLTDLYATCTEMLGIDHESPPDCLSLMPLMAGSNAHGRYERALIVSELTRQAEDRRSEEVYKWHLHSMRSDDEKCIIRNRKPTEELYDLREDAQEKHNIAAQNPPRVEQYRALRDQFLETASAGRTASGPSEPTATRLTDEDKREFQAIGYM